MHCQPVYSLTWLVGVVNKEAIWIHKGGAFLKCRLKVLNTFLCRNNYSVNKKAEIYLEIQWSLVLIHLSDWRVIPLLPKQQYCYRVSSNLIYLPHFHFLWCWYQLQACRWGISWCQQCLVYQLPHAGELSDERKKQSYAILSEFGTMSYIPCMSWSCCHNGLVEPNTSSLHVLMTGQAKRG